MSIHSILMTADTVGGVWTYALALSQAFGQHNIQVTLATMGAALTPQQQETVAEIRNLDIIEGKNEQGDSFKLEWMETPWEDVQKAGEWLLSLEAKLKPDVIHLNGYTHGALPWNSPVLMVGHSCVLSWWEAVKGENAPAAWSRYREEVTRGLQTANRVVAPTQAMLDALETHYGELKDKGVIPDGCNIEAFAPPLGRKEAFVFSAGRVWDEAKNIAVLEVVAPFLSCPVYVAGEKHEPQKDFDVTLNSRNDSPKSPLEKGIDFLGRLSPAEMKEWYAKAAIYALPAKYEPFGLSVLEAALSGCALVLGDIPSLRENWDKRAIFVQPDDWEGLKDAINDLIKNSEKRENLAQKSRNHALSFTAQRMAKGHLDAYRKILKP